MSDQRAATLGGRLHESAPRYGLVPAMALLEHFGRTAGAPPFGTESSPAQAAARLTTRASFAFPPSEIEKIDLATIKDEAPVQASLQSLGTGLLGHFGPLPDWVTEQLVQRARRGDRAAIAFLAMFEQRLQALAFRAQSRLWPGISFRPPEDSILGQILYALLGLGTKGLRARMDVPDRAVLGFCGILAGQTRSLGALERMLQSHLGLPVRAIPFAGRWLALEPEDVMRLGTRTGANNRLGQSALLGSRVWDCQSCFTLQIGPLEPDEHESLLPGRPRHRALVALTRFFAGPMLSFHLDLRLRPARISRLRISAGPQAARLGWTSFLIGRPDTRAAGAIRIAVRETRA